MDRFDVVTATGQLGHLGRPLKTAEKLGKMCLAGIFVQVLLVARFRRYSNHVQNRRYVTYPKAPSTVQAQTSSSKSRYGNHCKAQVFVIELLRAFGMYVLMAGFRGAFVAAVRWEFVGLRS